VGELAARRLRGVDPEETAREVESADGVGELRRERQPVLGGERLAIAADVGDPDDAARAVSAAVERFGGLDVVVNNAGIGDAAAVGEETPEGWERVMRTNLTGAFLVVREALPALIERRGCIVNVSSVNGYLAGPGWAAYCTSKAGLIMLTRTLANDPATRAIPVIMVSSKSQETDRIWGMRQGAVDFLVKPVSGADLVAKAREVLARSDS